MHESIRKPYEYAKREIDRWYTNTCRDHILGNKKNDAIECIYCIGKAVMLSLILEKNFGEDTKQEREHMKLVKDYLQFDLLENLEG